MEKINNSFNIPGNKPNIGIAIYLEMWFLEITFIGI